MAGSNDIALMAHLMRRAGFSASRDELEAAAVRGYDTVVDELLNPAPTSGVQDDLMLRYHPTYNHPGAIEINIQNWMYRMVNTEHQLREKMALFWHMIFCAGHSKIDSGEEMGRMIQMFRDHGMGNFRALLMHLSTSPAMVYYLDNCESHKTAIQRELRPRAAGALLHGRRYGRRLQLLRGRRQGLRARLHRLEHRAPLPAVPLWPQPLGVPLRPRRPRRIGQNLPRPDRQLERTSISWI